MGTVGPALDNLITFEGDVGEFYELFETAERGSEQMGVKVTVNQACLANKKNPR